MGRFWAPAGKWLVVFGLAIPALAFVSPAIVPGGKEWPLVFGVLWLAALFVSLPIILAGAGLCTVQVITNKGATKSDYLFFAIGVNGALLLLALAAVTFIRT